MIGARLGRSSNRGVFWVGEGLHGFPASSGRGALCAPANGSPEGSPTNVPASSGRGALCASANGSPEGSPTNFPASSGRGALCAPANGSPEGSPTNGPTANLNHEPVAISESAMPCQADSWEHRPRPLTGSIGRGRPAPVGFVFSHLFRVKALRRWFGSRSSSRHGLGGPRATSGLLLPSF